MKKFKDLPEYKQNMIRDLAKWGGYTSEEIAKAFKINKASVITLRGNHTRKINKDFSFQG